MKGNRGDDGRRGRDVGGGYKAFSQTTSGWVISVNDNASRDKRWRAVHDDFGTRYFDNHDEILEFTVRHMAKIFEQTPLYKQMRRQWDAEKK